MRDDDLKALIIKRSDAMRKGLWGTKETCNKWAKHAAAMCRQLGWWKEFEYLKNFWSL